MQQPAGRCCWRCRHNCRPLWLLLPPRGFPARSWSGTAAAVAPRGIPACPSPGAAPAVALAEPQAAVSSGPAKDRLLAAELAESPLTPHRRAHPPLARSAPRQTPPVASLPQDLRRRGPPLEPPSPVLPRRLPPRQPPQPRPPAKQQLPPRRLWDPLLQLQQCQRLVPPMRRLLLSPASLGCCTRDASPSAALPPPLGETRRHPPCHPSSWPRAP
mmetsp:Transcript_39978/g.125095  ORF Transcript_39978/g.125095 Transcript_39978/m.125095 type:complete len:215 (-) Transcript_39978:836-1480(-)